jgi:hypothetical protein
MKAAVKLWRCLNCKHKNPGDLQILLRTTPSGGCNKSKHGRGDGEIVAEGISFSLSLRFDQQYCTETGRRSAAASRSIRCVHLIRAPCVTRD